MDWEAPWHLQLQLQPAEPSRPVPPRQSFQERNEVTTGYLFL